jgi:hypothetical protein
MLILTFIQDEERSFLMLICSVFLVVDCTVLALLTIINRLSLLEQVIYMSLVGSFPFNAFLSGILSCIGSAVLAGAFLIQQLGFGYRLGLLVNACFLF